MAEEDVDEGRMITGIEVLEMIKNSVPLFVSHIKDTRYPFEMTIELVLGSIYRAAPDSDCFRLAVVNNVELREVIRLELRKTGLYVAN